METLNFIRLPVQLDSLWRLAAERSWFAYSQRHMDEGLALHHALGEVFGSAVLQPFRLMVPPRRKEGFVYAYSRSSADMLNENATLAGPEYGSVFDLKNLQLKPMPLTFEKGRRLGFDVRVRPVRRTRAVKGRVVREVDAFQHEAKATFPDQPRGKGPGEDCRRATNDRTRQAVYRDWLAERLKDAAVLASEDDVRLAHFRRSTAVRNGRTTEGPDAVLQGDLIVADPERFLALLSGGVGRHKAYGYGMLLLRPARTA